MKTVVLLILAIIFSQVACKNLKTKETTMSKAASVPTYTIVPNQTKSFVQTFRQGHTISMPVDLRLYLDDVALYYKDNPTCSVDVLVRSQESTSSFYQNNVNSLKTGIVSHLVTQGVSRGQIRDNIADLIHTTGTVGFYEVAVENLVKYN
jgi:hypothetical protein